MNIEELQNLIVKRSKLQLAIVEKQNFKSSLRKQIEAKIPQELQDELASLDVEFSTESEQNELTNVEELIKSETLALGQTVKVEGVGMAVYNKGRETVDVPGFKGYALVHPEVAHLIKVGNPYITLK